MKVALLSGHKDGAIDQVMQSVQKAVQPLGVEADIFGVYNDNLRDVDLDTYDIVHAGYFAYYTAIKDRTDQPITANIWHVGNHNEEKIRNFLGLSEIMHLVADDVMTIQQLGQEGIMNVTKIPLPVDPSKWTALPKPEGEFTVGVFCNDYPYKRWETIVQGAKQAGVKCLAFVMPEGRLTYDLDPLTEVYARVHVLASATFVDTNSLPLREALMCGRPVISTHNDGMGRVLQSGKNGYWFDGTPKDLAEKLVLCRDNYQRLAAEARETKMEPLEFIGSEYVKMWTKVLAEAL